MLVPYQEIQALGFPNSPHKLRLYEKPWTCISWYGPCTQLVNSKHSNVFSPGSRRQNFGRGSFWLSAPNLKDIPYKLDSPEPCTGFMLDMFCLRVHKTIASFVQKWVLKFNSIEHGGTRTFFHMVDRYFGNDLLEPFESKFIGFTGLVMTYLWLSWPSLMRGNQDIYQYYG